ncbi:MAG: hypothetical protein EKK49_02040 [Rhodocyclaceae bacterium]|nr:MAG: hypothetical protein EKK49_02040 [Rhodocyclaceae bacterium]
MSLPRRFALSIIACMAMQTSTSYAAQSANDLLAEFMPLISRVRGAIRYQFEQGRGCLPWSSLARDPKLDASDKATVDFAFTVEQARQLGEPSAEKIGALLAPKAKAGAFVMAAIGTCESDPSISDTASPNVITLVVERRDGEAVKMRFPFQQGSDGKLAYITSKASVGPTDPLVFGAPRSADAQQSIAITEQAQAFEISVPVSSLSIRLPKAGFKRELPRNVSGATASPRYFMFSDDARGIRLSGWFESASRFEGVKDSPPTVLQGRTLAHQNVVKKKTGAWDTVESDQVDGSLHLNMTNIHAHVVRAGSWIELHLSMNSAQPLATQREQLAEVLRSIQIVER